LYVKRIHEAVDAIHSQSANYVVSIGNGWPTNSSCIWNSLVGCIRNVW